MFCVCIACGSHERMIAEMKRLKEDNVGLAELRLDILRKEPDFLRIIKSPRPPVIVTARRPSEGGLWKESEEKRLRLLRTAIIEGVEYVDLELDVAVNIPRFGKTKRIISYHNLTETPDLYKIREEILKADPDIIKIAVMPKSIMDVFRMLDFMKDVNKPGEKIKTVGISMSECGAMTRILANKFGAPYAYSSFSEKREIAPGMLYYKDLRDLYRFDDINAETQVYGVVADPIRHSLSPLIHNASFKEHKLNKVYLPFRVAPEDLTDFVDNFEKIDLCGLSVTIPHKVAILKSLTNIGPAVKEIDACNTVIFSEGKRIGFNTDYMAAILSIQSAMGLATDQKGPLHGKRALVLGAGGAGKALAYGLKEKGASVIVSDGREEAAHELAAYLECEWREWAGREKEKVDILVNCTPIGMYPNLDQCPVDGSILRPGMVVFDSVYNPEFTWLIRQAAEKGCTIVPGMEMFVGQAALQFKLFTGEKASIDLMRKLVKAALSAVHEPEDD
ncbi:MAG: shikimate dehydrogenase [Planctomycetia bacterium]|nr:shikimate dehydrogenase [Planctomycetia bacterium]